MSKKYIIANWKMSPQSVAEAEDILAYLDEHLRNMSSPTLRSGPRLSDVGVVICPPFVFLDDVGKILDTSRLVERAELGAQDIATTDSGAWTGEVSGPMLKRLGVKYIIVGHSERRWNPSAGGGESNEVVNKKIKTVLANEMTPIVCIGEKSRDRDYKEFLQKQIEATFVNLSADEISRCFIAYEPVWAISTNPNSHPSTPVSTLESIAVIKDCLSSKFLVLNPKILYGGSVSAENVKSFISLNEISGVLVGGASVKKEEFVEIIKNA